MFWKSSIFGIHACVRQEEMADKDVGIANKVASILRTSLQQIEGLNSEYGSYGS